MLQKFNTSILKLLSFSPDERTDFSSVEDNPLVGYLKIYQNQHKLIFIFYRGLIFSFGSFFLLISFFIFNAHDSVVIPRAGLFALFLIDLLLLFFIAKAIREFKKYREKSGSTLREIYKCLKKDLEQFERLKKERGFIQNKGSFFGCASTAQKKPGKNKIKNHVGWDKQTCPKCDIQVEMLETVCPNCASALIKNYPF